MSGKALAARGFEPPWGKRKAPAFVSKAGTSYGIKRYRQVLCANSFTSLAELSLHRAGKARDPEMHQIRKGNEWRFGMKCHVGVDAGGGLVHTVTVTSANKHDITETVNLIREDDEVVYGDSGDISAFRNALKFSKTSIFPRSISELTVVQRVYPK